MRNVALWTLVFYGGALVLVELIKGKVAGVVLAALGGVGLAVGAATMVVVRGHQRRRGSSQGLWLALALGAVAATAGIVALVDAVFRLASR